MVEYQTFSESYLVWSTFLWCFYPIGFLVVFDLISRGFDDDDDQDGGMMIPAYQGQTLR